MRGVLAVAACLVVGCYAPTTPAGIACDPAAPHCPRGQTCVTGSTGATCEIGEAGGAGPFDAPSDVPDDAAAADSALDGAMPDAAAIDAPVALDTDGDTVLDTADNCPMRANTNQYNEDGDRFGDVCDPCPPIADNNPLDGDGDGVADACDPRPTLAGDSITRFEGFAAGVPTTGWTKTGTWTAAGGSVTGDATATKAMLLVAGPTTGHLTVSTSMVMGTVPATGDGAAGIMDAYDTNANTGIYCHLTIWGAPNTPLVINAVAASGTVLDSNAFEMVSGTTYSLKARRDADVRTCDGRHGGISATASGSSTVTASAPAVGLRLVHTKATYAWLMVVAN